MNPKSVHKPDLRMLQEPAFTSIFLILCSLYEQEEHVLELIAQVQALLLAPVCRNMLRNSPFIYEEKNQHGSCRFFCKRSGALRPHRTFSDGPWQTPNELKVAHFLNFLSEVAYIEFS